jgi:hypothetical protein
MPIPLRADFDAARLRGAARARKDAGQTRQLLALAAIYDGASRSEGRDRRCDVADRSRLGGEAQRIRAGRAWWTKRRPVLSRS